MLCSSCALIQSQLSSSDPVTIDIYYKLKIIKLEGAHDKIMVEAAHKSCVSCVLRCEEKGEGGDHLLGILLVTHTGTRPCG